MLLLVSCNQDDSFVIGNNWIDSETIILNIDTLTVRSSTIKFDSMIVDANKLLVGYYEDEIFGKTKSEIFTQIIGPNFELDDEAIYDSIALILNYNNYFYNDTLSPQKLNIYQVIDDIKPENEYYYNTTQFNYNNLIGTKTYIPRPIGKDSLHVSINYDFGYDIFSRIQNHEINNLDAFLDEYKGILIQADIEESKSIIGFNKDSFLRFYYTIEDDSGDINGTWDFPFNPTNSFNHIESDREETIFENLTNQEVILPSVQTGNNSYLQSGVGIVTRIDIPYIKSLYNIHGKGTIIDAKLKLSLKQNESNQLLYTKDSLSLYLINNNSEITSGLFNFSGQTIYGVISQIDPEFNTVIYSIPIKPFLDIKLSDDANYDDVFLAIGSKTLNNSLERYVFYGENNTELKKLKLEVTYAIYNDN